MLMNYSELHVFVCWSSLHSASYANAPIFTSCSFVLPYLFQELDLFDCSLLYVKLQTYIHTCIFLLDNHFPNQTQSCLATIGELTDIKRQFRSSITALDFPSQSRRSNFYWYFCILLYCICNFVSYLFKQSCASDCTPSHKYVRCSLQLYKLKGDWLLNQNICR